MDQAPGGLSGSVHDGATLEPIQSNEEIQGIMAPVPAPENANSFTTLLELPPTSAVELLHSPESDSALKPPTPTPASKSCMKQAAEEKEDEGESSTPSTNKKAKSLTAQALRRQAQNREAARKCRLRKKVAKNEFIGS